MKLITGKVISKKMQKTATVLVERITAHKIYKKHIKLTKKYQVHDEKDSQVGDLVRFVEGPKVSKTKRWRIVEVVKGPAEKAKKPGGGNKVSKDGMKAR